jgi:hypothetical protein
MPARVELAPHQGELVDDIESEVIALSGGYGAGKTWALCAWAVDRALRNGGARTLIIEPTYPMVVDVLVPTMEDFLDKHGIPWSYAVAKKTFYIGPKKRQIICRSGEKPGRLKGLTVGAAALDEFEMQSEEVALVAISRLRDVRATCYQLALVGTPEGFGWGYRWLEEKPKKGTRVIKARTVDNDFRRKGYEENIRLHLSDEEAAEKLDGVRTLPGGRVYTRFSRQKHHRDAPADWTHLPGRIELWCDFNVGLMCWAVVNVVGDVAHVVDEIIGYDTDALEQAEKARRYLAGKFKVTEQDVMRMRIPMVCDASGSNRSAAAPMSMVMQATSVGFRPVHPPANPPVEDRVASVQGALTMQRLYFDTRRAPFISRCFEQQARDPSGAPAKNNANPKEDMSAGTDAVGYGIYVHWPAFRPSANRPASTRMRVA